MKKVKSVLIGFLGWGKARSLNTFPQILFGLLSLILPKIFIIQSGEALSKRLVHLNLTIPNTFTGGIYDILQWHSALGEARAPINRCVWFDGG